MMVTIETRESKTKRTKCSCCESLIFTCEKYFQVVNYNTGKPVSGGKYCKGCKEEMNETWDDKIIEEDDDDDGEAGLRQREDYAAYRVAGCTHEYWSDRDEGYAH